MASAFLGKYASITVVDLIQRKKLGFRKSKLAEARFEISYHSIRIMTVVAVASDRANTVAVSGSIFVG